MIKSLLLVSGVFLTAPLMAETLNVEYASFYSHVKKIDNEETDKLRFAFGFQHIAYDRLCKVDEANILTQKQVIPLQVENASRFTVPADKILKMAKATVSIQLDDNANQCDMSVQLETQPEYLKKTYTHSELISLLEQYQAFFSNMGSFMSFMMPSAEGLVFHFTDSPHLTKELEALLDDSGNIVLDDAWLDKGESLQLPQLPLRVTALVVK